MNTPLSPIEISLISILARSGGACKTINIVHSYQSKRKNTPKQTVYRALGLMKKKEIITTAKGITTINTIWIGRIKSLIDQLESNALFAEFPRKLSLSFPSLWSAAPVLAHYANILISQSSREQPIIWINPHQWFYCARDWSEEQLIESIVSSGHSLLQCIIHRSSIATQLLKTKFNHSPAVRGSYIDTKPSEQNTYLAIIGEYVVTTVFSDSLNAKLDHWFKTYAQTTDENREELRSLIKENHTVKITFKHDPKTAQQYQKRVQKFFG
jgi:hypothetical protein